MPSPFGNLHPFGGLPGGALPRDPQAPMQSANFQDLFGLILQSMQPPTMTRGELDDHRGHALSLHPLGLLNQLFNPRYAQHGDIFVSLEGFDRVMSQLMEHHSRINAPLPASEEAIQSLELKPNDLLYLQV
ncbi:hypothetical protein LTR80_012107 [Exophiala xenobiotica]